MAIAVEQVPVALDEPRHVALEDMHVNGGVIRMACSVGECLHECLGKCLHKRCPALTVYISLRRTTNGHICALDSGGVLALHL
jgi:hypothetical protein